MIRMRPPLTYYGGKQRLAGEIVSRIPADHICYGSVFAGGAAEFFAKGPSEIEILNDTNKEIMNFYQIVKAKFLDLEKMINISLHSRSMHQDAAVIYNNPHLFSDIKRAWAVWILATQSFSSMLDGTWGYDKKRNQTTKKVDSKKVSFTEEYAIRLQNVQLECADALYIIQSRDTKDSFFYCDPPYFNSDCGHYGGYTKEDFVRLLQTLSRIKGRFLLSSYPSQELQEYTRANGWMTVSFEQPISVNKGSTGRKKIEVMTANYAI
ncbi:MAG: DNA adenine methylase [Sphingobacteriales bacterium]|nr:DNA adenine methylase [Sphingobacteriales bacterium]